MLHRARQLRRQSTDAEHRLWCHLRNRRLGGWKFRRQHHVDRYIADFACLKARLIIELDGGQHACGQRGYDEQRDAVLRAHGFTVLRFWNDDVLQDTEAVLAEVWRVLEATGKQPG